jgi:hypothetical protein
MEVPVGDKSPKNKNVKKPKAAKNVARPSATPAPRKP